ncbi:hypothetical protein, partial [Citrobacter freundii]|uniref:hypothetical protein n=1 Tax=Citrobacter freundii TaxID=546 RepID=UPI001A935ED9
FFFFIFFFILLFFFSNPELPPPCKGGALPAELITPAVWSRIIGRVENESTHFLKNLFVRRKFKQNDRKSIHAA